MPKISTEIGTGQLAYMWSTTKKTVMEWTKTWLGPAKQGRGNYDMKQCHDLYVQYKIMPEYARDEDTGESKEEAHRRYEIARANKAELQAAQLQGQLIPRDESVKWLVEHVSNAKAGFLATPRRMAPLLYGKDIREIEELLREEIYAILTKLARPTKDKKAK